MDIICLSGHGTIWRVFTPSLSSWGVDVPIFSPFIVILSPEIPRIRAAKQFFQTWMIPEPVDPVRDLNHHTVRTTCSPYDLSLSLSLSPPSSPRVSHSKLHDPIFLLSWSRKSAYADLQQWIPPWSYGTCEFDLGDHICNQDGWQCCNTRGKTSSHRELWKWRCFSMAFFLRYYSPMSTRFPNTASLINWCVTSSKFSCFPSRFKLCLTKQFLSQLLISLCASQQTLYYWHTPFTCSQG